MATSTLERLNTPPAQTWNYLRINDAVLEVPAIANDPARDYSASVDATPVRPDAHAGLEMGAGDAATAWLTSAATSAASRHTVRVSSDSPQLVEVNLSAGDVTETNVELGPDAEATIVVTASASPADAPSTTGNLLRITAARGARVTLAELVALPDSHQHLDDVGIELGQGASIEVRQYVLGAGTAVLGLAANLAGARSSLTLATRYLARGRERLDLNHVVRMRGTDTRAQVDESGVLDDDAEKTLRATIDLVRGAKGAKGREQETVLVAGDSVVNKTLPVILCDEDDVAGDHGATIGSVSQDQLSYLADRGLTEEDATELFSSAVIDDAVLSAPTGAFRDAALAIARDLLGDQAANDLAEAEASFEPRGGDAR